MSNSNPHLSTLLQARWQDEKKLQRDISSALEAQVKSDAALRPFPCQVLPFLADAAEALAKSTGDSGDAASAAIIRLMAKHYEDKLALAKSMKDQFIKDMLFLLTGVNKSENPLKKQSFQ